MTIEGKSIDRVKLVAELEKLRAENADLHARLLDASVELTTTKEYFRNELPKIVGTDSKRYEKAVILASDIITCQKNINRHMVDVKERTKASNTNNIDIEVIDFFHNKITELAVKLRTLCESIGSSEEISEIVGDVEYDYSCNEFLVNTTSRLIKINGKTTRISRAEFSFFKDLLHSPNKEVEFENLNLARTNIARLKARVPELDKYIHHVHGRTTYVLHITPITTI